MTDHLSLSRRWITRAAVTALGLLASCGDEPPPAPASIAKLAGDGQQAVAGSTLATAPSVLVADASGNPIQNLTVVFAVASGEGTIGAASVMTGVDGIAATNSWKLGNKAGANTLTATIGSLSATFTATGVAGPPTKSSKTAGDNQTVVAGAAAAVAPQVTVLDANDNPVSGVAVSFVVASGGGSVAGGSQTTNASGVATTAWTVGTTVGSNTLSVTPTGLPAMTFTATAVAGPAAKSSKTAGDNQTAMMGSTLSIAPQVTVLDANNNPVSGAAVTFAVASGGGVVTGGSQTTNASGVATVGGWTVGATPGANTLTASVAAVPTLTFTATAADPCTVAPAFTVGVTTNGSLTANDCKYNSAAFIDYYTLAPTALTSFRLVQRSAAFNTLIRVFDGTTEMGFSNDSSTGNTNAYVRALAPPGSFRIGASASASGLTGDYTLESSIVPEGGTGVCESTFLFGALTTSQALSTTDCRRSNFMSDQFTAYFKPGVTYEMILTTSAFDPWVGLFTTGGSSLGFSNSIGGPTPRSARMTFNTSTGGLFIIAAEAVSQSQSGAYTLTWRPVGSSVLAGADPGPGTVIFDSSPRGSLIIPVSPALPGRKP